MPQHRFNFSAFEGYLVEQGVSALDVGLHRKLAEQFLTYHARKPLGELKPADVDRFVRDLLEAQASAQHLAVAKRAANEVLGYLRSIQTGFASEARMSGGHVGADPLKARAKRFTGQQAAILSTTPMPSATPSNPFERTRTGVKHATFTGPSRSITHDPRSSSSLPGATSPKKDEPLHPYFTGEHTFVEAEEDLHPFFSGEHGAVPDPGNAPETPSQLSGPHRGVARARVASGSHRAAAPNPAAHRAAHISGSQRRVRQSGSHPNAARRSAALRHTTGGQPVLPNQPMVPPPEPVHTRVERTQSQAKLVFAVLAAVMVVLIGAVLLFM